MTTSEQARLDAMADAETLWTHTPNYYADAFEAARYGDWCHRAIFGWMAPADADVYARHAARAAFRAVPGLRG